MIKYKTEILFSGDTDLGKNRTNNEDAFLVQNIWGKNHVLAVVIDGVGGYEGGEVAAAIAQKTIVEYLEKYQNGERLDLLKQAVVSANNSIFSRRQKQEDLTNMCCVLTAVLVEIEKKQINMVHVGDTRLYQYYKNELKKLSHDHSLVGYREEVGDLTEEEAMHHPQRNIISRDVGSAHHEISDRDFLEAATFSLFPNSTLLLCSDGLCDMITSVQIKQVLQRKTSLEEKVKELIDKANLEGGKDNITVVLVDNQSNEPENDTVKVQTNINIEPVIETEGQISTQPVKMKKCSTVLKMAFTTIILLLVGWTIGWFAHGKYNFTNKQEPILQDTLKPAILQISVRDSLLIINNTDTVLVKNTISGNIDGIWVKSDTLNSIGD